MARRPPARVRADVRNPTRVGFTVRNVPDLSPRGVAVIARLERTRFWPGAVARALDVWSEFVRDPMRRNWNPEYGCGESGCCPDPFELRGILEAAARVLPPSDARALRRRLAALDELW